MPSRNVTQILPELKPGDTVVTPSGYSGEVRYIVDGVHYIKRHDIPLTVPYDRMELEGPR